MNLKRWIKPFQNAKSPYLKLVHGYLAVYAATKIKSFLKKKDCPWSLHNCKQFYCLAQKPELEEFRIKRFTLSEKFQWNAPKFDTYCIYVLTHIVIVFVFHFMQLYYFIPYEFPALWWHWPGYVFIIENEKLNEKKKQQQRGFSYT